MAVPKEQFAGLIEAHPETSLHLLESMARTINTLNARLAAMIRSKKINISGYPPLDEGMHTFAGSDEPAVFLVQFDGLLYAYLNRCPHLVLN